MTEAEGNEQVPHNAQPQLQHQQHEAGVKRPREVDPSEQLSSTKQKTEEPPSEASGAAEPVEPTIAAVDTQQVQPTTPAAALAAVSLTGDRLEVMWELELDGESVRKWWPCTLDRRGDGTLTEAGQHVFALTYDAFGEFDVCTRRVTFQAPHCLHDIEEGVGMRFRREGEQLPGDEEEEEEGEEDEEGDELVAPGDHIVDLDELVGQDGGSDQPLLAGMQHLPMVQQQNIALAMRGMMDAFKEKLREHMSAKPSGSEDADVVTRDDVRTILEDLGRQRHTQEIADGA